MSNEHDQRWTEIRCNYLDEDDLFWRVDAWATDDDSEEGTVIAYIDDITGRVLYTDPLARVDKYAQEVITDAVKNLHGTVQIEKRPACIEARIPSKHGIICVSIEPDDCTGADNDAVYIGLEASQDPYVYFDLAAVLSNKEDDTVDILTWKDIEDEDYTEKTTIPASSIKDLIEFCKE